MNIIETDKCGYEWVRTNCNNVPKSALVAGTDKGRPLYVSRERVDDVMLSGKFVPEHQCTYIAHNDEELDFAESEILCFSEKSI